MEYSQKGRFQKDSLGFLPFFSIAFMSAGIFSEPTFIQLLISRGLFPVIVIMNLYVIIEYDFF